MIRILDENLDVLETVTAYTSVSWTHRFADVGSFEIQIPLDKCPAHLMDGTYIRHYDNYGIIRYIYQNNTHINVQGQDLKGLLTYRMAFGNKSGKVEMLIKEYVSENTKGNRAFPLFSIVEDTGTGEEISHELGDTGARLDNLCKSICEAHGIGYKVYVKDKQIYFDIALPTVRDYTYSKRRNNIKEYEYTKDNLNDVNCVYRVLKPSGFKINVKDDDGKNIVVEKGTACFSNGAVASTESEMNFGITSSGIYYFYASYKVSSGAISIFHSSTKPSGMNDTSGTLYCYLGCVSSGVVSDNDVAERIIQVIDNDAFAGLARKEGVISLNGNNEENAESVNNYLSENKAVENVQASIFDPSHYKTEWELGDYINIRLDVMGERLTVSRQVSEVTEVFESGNRFVSCIFGNVRESILRKIIKGRM